MNPIRLYLKHILISLLLLIILIGGLFFEADFIRSFLVNPFNYINTDLSILDIHYVIIIVSLMTIAVLISFIFYLLLTFKSRFDFQIWNATKSIALSREQFMKLYENAPVPYILLGKNAEIHEPNKATLRFFGVTKKEIEGKDIFSYAGNDSKDQAAILSQYFKNGESVHRKELQMVTNTGAVKSVLLSIFIMKDLGGSTYNKNKGLAMMFDITEQKLLDKAKTEFVSLASHQMRAPLATTKWYTEMLHSGDLGDLNAKQKEYIERLNLVNNDMIEMVEVLLNVSRIEMGALPIDPKPTNVEELTENILVELSSEITKKNLTIEKNYNNHLGDIQADPKLLRIVIQNIISNSVKYTQDGGRVSITFEESSSSRKIIISDTGIGIPEADKARIFSKLFRADNARILSTSQGTGLGLYLVKSIIESMGGGIEFVSEENKGSTFTLTL